MAGGGSSVRLDQAVRREREAIRLHESTAVRQEASATQFDERAADDTDDQERSRSLGRAATARARAVRARERASQARARLLAEGFDPDD